MKKRSHIDHLLDGQHSAIDPFTNIQLEIQLIYMGLEEYLKLFLFIADHARVFSYRIEFSHPSVTRIKHPHVYTNYKITFEQTYFYTLLK